MPRIRGLSVQVYDILQVGDKLRAYLWNARLLVLPGLERVFLGSIIQVMLCPERAT